jgi:hypothetical protein
MFGWFRKTRPIQEDQSVDDKMTPTDVPVEEETSDQYFSDQPILSHAQDRFNRSAFASRIADTIATRIDPSSIVLGLFGPWGDGKTSVLEMMQETLHQYPKVIVVRFNPWHFQTEDLLIRGFFATLAEAMDKSLPNMIEKAGDLLKKYGSLLSLGSLTFGGVVQLKPGDAAKGLGEAMSNVGLDELRVRIEGMLDESKRRLVVLIDDIDRLDRDETHAIFKLVKLSASFRHTSYILAFDDNVVSAALGERYGAGGASAGKAFLEKIIQVPLHLPQADENSLRLLALEGVQSSLNQAEIILNQAQVDAFVRHFDDGLWPRLDTPRRAKLYTNALMFALPILKGEVNPVDLMLIEGIRVFYPALYVGIRDNPELFLRGDRDNRRNAFQQGPAAPIDTLLDRCLPGTLEEERNVVKARLLAPLFPRIGNTIYGGEWDRIWGSDQKVCSSQYFKRYFTYSVPLGDVPDAQVAALVKGVSATDDAGRRLFLDDFARRQALPRVISMLRQRDETITSEQASALITTFAQNSDLLPRERGMMVLADTMTQGAILISALLRRIPTGQPRQSEAERLLRIAQPLSFALECIRWIRHYENRPEEMRVLSDEGEKPLQDILLARIEEENTISPLYLTYTKDAPALYWEWSKQAENAHVQEALENRFNAEPNEVDTFLSCYVGEAWGMETGLPRPADFQRDQYNSVSKIISAEYIAANLRQRYGAELDSPQNYPDERMAQSRRVAHQFMSVHQFVLQEANVELQESMSQPIEPDNCQ